MPRTKLTGIPKDQIAKCGQQTRGEDKHPCNFTAGFGTEHLGTGKCRIHGGNSPTHLKKAANDEVKAQMRMHFGDLVDIDPAGALLQEVQRSAGIVKWITEIVRDFTGIDVGSENIDVSAARKAVLEATAFQGWQAAAWVDLFFKERRHLAQVAKMALDAGVAERQVKIEEEKMIMVAGAIQGIFNELSLTAEQRAIFPGIARRHLEALGAA